MSFITITFTRLRKLGRPSPLPDISKAEARSWAAGWWAGIAVGLVNGIGLAVFLYELIGGRQ